MKYCPECGRPLANESANFCDNCGAKLSAAPTITVRPPDAGTAGTGGAPGSSAPAPAPEPVIVRPAEEKSTALAAICSLVIPGLGQVYDGKTGRGFAIYFGTVIGLFIYVIPGLLVWAFGIYDAYSLALQMNKKEIPFLPTNTSHLIIFFILALIIAVVVFVLLMLVAFAAIIGTAAHAI